MNKPVAYTSRAIRDLKRLDESARRRIVEAIERHARTGAGDVKRLKGQSSGDLRLRVGDWRVFFIYGSDDRIIMVNRVVHRAQAY